VYADNSDFETAFKMFEKCRLKRTKWITDTSRKVGLIAQLENPLLIRLRNAALRLMPSSAGERQLRELGKTDFKYQFE
jgi:2-polyprenyl-6-methoxyphenol hydroxylase-like FAD-dependent oxidoreductase